MIPILITPAEVLELAFHSNECLREELINETLIESAQLKYLKPILGPLYDNLNDPQYSTLKENYLKIPLAYYVRSLVVEELATSVGAMGVTHGQSSYSAPASLREQALLRKKARSNAKAFMRKATDHLEAHPELYPEYDPRQNIQSHLSLQGGVAL